MRAFKTDGTRAAVARLNAARVKMLGEHAADPAEKDGYFRLEREYLETAGKVEARAKRKKPTDR